MMPTPSRYTLLIAVSLLTAGVAVFGTSTTLASEPQVERGDTGESEAPRNLTLSGQVTNASSGEPVPELELRIYNLWTSEDGDFRSRDVLSAVTDEQGRYSVNVSQGEVGLRIDDPRYQLARAEFPIEDDLQLDIPLEPVDPDRARIAGTVTDEGGEPIEEAHVRVDLSREDCEQREHPEECEERARTRSDREETTHEVETDQGTVEFTYEPRINPHASASTDEDGGYEVRVPAGPYRVTARAQDHLSNSTTVDAAENDTARADLSLTPIPPASVTVEGQIVDAETDEGIHGARVSLDNQRWGTYNATHTDEQGRFQLAIEPGYTTVQITAGERYRVPCEAETRSGDGGDAKPRDCDPYRERSTVYLPVSTTIQPEADEQMSLDRALEPEPEPEARLEGWVVDDATGEAVPNATLSFHNEETTEWGRGQAGEDGSFRIQLDRGYYTVRIHAEGYFAKATNLRVEDEIARETFELTEGQPAEGGCCRAYHHDAAVEDGGVQEADAAAGPSPPPPSGGEETYHGEAGNLGDPPATTSEGPIEPLETVPASGALTVAVVLVAGAAFLSRRRRLR